MYKKVLLIDDDDDEQLIFSEALKILNTQTEFFFACGGAEGISMAKLINPDFIFIDFNMPVINGMECLEKIRQNDIRKSSQLILYSTGLTDKLCEQAIHKGAVVCIKKETSLYKLAGKLKDFF